MSDKEARILGAGSSIEIDGKEYKLSPIRMQQLMELQREAVNYYKRQYLQTFSDNLDLIPNGEQLLEKKLEEVARWDIKDCPTRVAFDCSLVQITDELKDRLREEYNIEDASDEPESDFGWQAILSSALDSEKIKPNEIEKLAKGKIRKAIIPYDAWWTSATYEGLIATVYSSIHYNHPEVTKKQLQSITITKMMEANRLTEKLTTPDMGNT